MIILIIIGLICIFLPKCNQLRELQDKKGVIAEDNRAIEIETNELRTKQEKFNSNPAVVERTAREIGMVKPDEIVFKFTNRQSVATEAPQ